MSIKCMREAKFKRSCDTFSAVFFTHTSELKYFLLHIERRRKQKGKIYENAET